MNFEKLKPETTPKKLLYLFVLMDLIFVALYFFGEDKNERSNLVKTPNEARRVYNNPVDGTDNSTRTGERRTFENETDLEGEARKKNPSRNAPRKQSEFAKIKEKIQNRAKKNIRESYEKAKAQYELKKKFTAKTGVEPLVPKGFSFQKYQEAYAPVEVMVAENLADNVKIYTVFSSVSFDWDDMDKASMELFNTPASELEPVEKHGLSHPGLKKIQVFEMDDINPVYVVKGKLKNNSKKEVYFSVVGDGAGIQKHLSEIKKSFKNLKIK